MKGIMFALSFLLGILGFMFTILFLLVIVGSGYQGEVVGKDMYHATLISLTVTAFASLNCYAIKSKEEL